MPQSSLDRLKALEASGGLTPSAPPGTPEDDELGQLRTLQARRAAKRTASNAPPALTGYDQQQRDLTPGQMLGQQAREFAIGALEPFTAQNVASGIKTLATGAGQALMGKPMPLMRTLKGMVEAPIAPVQNLYNAYQSGDLPGMANAAGAITSQTLPAIQGAGNLAAEGVRSLSPAQAIRTRAIQSILRPDKGAFDFGADPVQEVANLPPSTSIDGMHRNVRTAILEREFQLQNAIRGQIAKSEDIEPLMRSQIQPVLQQANRWAKGGATMKMVNRAMDSYLEDLRNRRGGTALNPAEVLDEKRLLNNEIKFKANDQQGQNLNAVKVGVYRSLDKALDKMVPEATTINKSYSGLVEADHLLRKEKLIRGNAPLTGETAFQTAVGVVPDVAVKSRIASALKPQAPSTIGAVAPITNAPKTAKDYLMMKAHQ